MSLKAIYGLTEEEALVHLNKQYLKKDAHFQSKVLVSPSQLVGNAALFWHRGHHVGIYSAFLTLKEKYPEAAESLLRAFRMNKEGSIDTTEKGEQ